MMKRMNRLSVLRPLQNQHQKPLLRTMRTTVPRADCRRGPWYCWESYRDISAIGPPSRLSVNGVIIGDMTIVNSEGVSALLLGPKAGFPTHAVASCGMHCS